ncbi:hypothetical protein AnigIFM56816_004437 [Aspergillus niger]|nr:hypothetical protein AnigIFM56816_004437 [Aspergillus niger]
MECAGRALLFWTYQTTQEIFYQEFLAKTLTEKYTNLNTQLDKVVHNANSEISALQARISDMETAQDQLRKKNQELVDMYREKCKKFTQMTNLYNILKSRAMRSQMQTAATDTVSQALDSLTASRNNPTGLVPGHSESKAWNKYIAINGAELTPGANTINLAQHRNIERVSWVCHALQLEEQHYRMTV